MILIAPVNQEDIAAICEMERRFFSPPYSQSALEHEKTHPDAVFLATREEERLVGYVLLRCLGDEGELHRIAVLPEWRGRGIALGLLANGIDLCARRGAGTIWLEVREGNAPARALYSRFGFTQEGLRKRYYEDPQEDAVIMAYRAPRGKEETPC
jgi:ribosomal-protein-alanine N-acetyltransferase